MSMEAYLEQAHWALVVVPACLVLLIVGSSLGIVTIARLTACSATEAAAALATVLGVFRRRSPERLAPGLGALGLVGPLASKAIDPSE
jgi:hypothetical protein